METILMVSFPVIQKGEIIVTQVIPVTTSGFMASVKGEKNGGFKNLEKKIRIVPENKPKLLFALYMVKQQHAMGH